MEKISAEEIRELIKNLETAMKLYEQALKTVIKPYDQALRLEDIELLTDALNLRAITALKIMDLIPKERHTRAFRRQFNKTNNQCQALIDEVKTLYKL